MPIRAKDRFSKWYQLYTDAANSAYLVVWVVATKFLEL